MECFEATMQRISKDVEDGYMAVLIFLAPTKHFSLRVGLSLGQSSLLQQHQGVSKVLGAVVHACNYSYMGGKDQEDSSSRPGWKKSL